MVSCNLSAVPTRAYMSIIVPRIRSPNLPSRTSIPELSNFRTNASASFKTALVCAVNSSVVMELPLLPYDSMDRRYPSNMFCADDMMSGVDFRILVLLSFCNEITILANTILASDRCSLDSANPYMICA